MLNVLVVEDSIVVRESLRAMFAEIDGVRIVGEVDLAQAAIAAIEEVRPDVVVLDLKLRQGSGVDVLLHARRNKSQAVFIIFSSYADSSHRQRLLLAGADYFFSKTEENDQLCSVLAELAAQARDSAGELP